MAAKTISDASNLKLAELLIVLEDTITTKRKLLEKLCHDAEKLFNPWPKTPSDKEDETEKKVEKIVKEEAVITSEEQQGMNLVNSLLRRAEKARTFQKKIIERELSSDVSAADRIKTQHENEKEDKTKAKEEKVSEDTNTTKIIKDQATDQKSSESNHGIKLNAEKSRPVKTKHELNKKPTVINSSRLASHDSNKISNKQSVPVTKVINRSANCSRPGTSVRPSSRSSISSTGSARNRSVPVHMSAPFKTDPNIKVFKRNSTINAIVQSSKPTVKSKYLNSTKSVKKSNNLKCRQPSNSHSKPSQSSYKEIENTIPCTPIPREEEIIGDVNKFRNNVVDASINNIVISDNTSSKDIILNHKPAVDATNIIEELSSLSLEASPAPEEKESHIFHLYKDGSTLKIPAKLKKATIQNRKLCQKVAQVSVTKKVGVSERDKFLHNVESLFDKESQPGVQHRKLKCLTTHLKLQKVLSELHLENINELSTPYDVLYAKMMVEFILTAYHDYEDETRQLIRDRDCKLTTSTNKETSIFQKPATLPFVWLPEIIHLENLEYPSQITYRNKRELQRYHTSIFKLQLLHLQKYLLRTVRSQLLDELKNMDNSSQDYVAMYRGVTALLTCHGNHLSPVVHET